jgi:transcriptional regulator with XRE-family HTH domain
MDILERIKMVRAYKNLSERAFALECKIDQGTFTNQMKGVRKLNVSVLVAVLERFPDVSAEWLIRGNGNMIINKDSEVKNLERINSLLDTISSLQSVINEYKTKKP